MKSRLYQNSPAAQGILKHTLDLRRSLMLGAVCESKTSVSAELSALMAKTMVQYQTQAARAVLMEHQPENQEPSVGFPENRFRLNEARSWSILRRIQLQLEQQHLMLKELKRRRSFPFSGNQDFEVELDDFRNVLEETKSLVAYRHDKLDQKLNASLFEEASANLIVARQSVAESQRTGLRRLILCTLHLLLLGHCADTDSNTARFRLRAHVSRYIGFRHEPPGDKSERPQYSCLHRIDSCPIRPFSRVVWPGHHGQSLHSEPQATSALAGRRSERHQKELTNATGNAIL